jgi:pimeloyl-ACP methyl ester carboxylesterase
MPENDKYAGMFEEPRLVTTGGGRKLAAYVFGEGKPVVLLPGTWDLAASFRELVDPLVRGGHQVVAFDLPGHGRSESWGRAHITLAELADALHTALDSLGVERALVVGHDFGARLGREHAARRPDRVVALVSIGMILSGRMPVDPSRLFHEALGPRFFVLALQRPGEIEALLAEDVAKTLSFFHRGACEGSVPFEGTTYALFDELSTFEAEHAAGRPLHDEVWFRRYVEAFQASGFRDALAMLRPLTQNWEDESRRPERLEMPVAVILGERDALVPPARLEGFEPSDCFSRFSAEIIAGAGHFPQLEASSNLCARLLAFSESAAW